jgi:hypothetical protein
VSDINDSPGDKGETGEAGSGRVRKDERRTGRAWTSVMFLDRLRVATVGSIAQGGL